MRTAKNTWYLSCSPVLMLFEAIVLRQTIDQTEADKYSFVEH